MGQTGQNCGHGVLLLEQPSKRMYDEWGERGLVRLTEQNICDQVREIWQSLWVSEVELEATKRWALKISSRENDKNANLIDKSILIEESIDENCNKL